MRNSKALVAVMVLGCGISAAPLSGQSAHEAEVRQLRAQLDSLNPRLYQIAARDSVKRRLELDSINRLHTISLDTAVIGPFRITGAHTAVRRTQPYFERAWESMAPLFQGQENAMSGTVFLVSQGGYSAPNLRRMGGLANHRHAYFPRLPDPIVWQATADGLVGGALMPLLPPALRAWVGNGVIGMVSEADAQYRYLVLPNKLRTGNEGVRCANGEVSACRAVLGLVRDVPASGSHPLRTSFLTFVLHQAPAGAVAAAGNDTGSAASILEQLGGKPLDALIADWVTDLKSTRAREASTAGHRVLSTLAWLAIFGAFAMRSTRWRLR